MSIVSSRVDQNLYVLVVTPAAGRKFYWLTTLATNRHDCWKAGERWVRDAVESADKRAVLKSEGYRCVKVRVEVVEEV